ncbi:MAG: hypothetical protein IT428_32310 [Planctomycetaceae bacterium]|nr:hypothetical protein [Planctomycetaceae bacterium]
MKTIPDDYPDWLCTVAFYSAVELVEQLLAAKNHHSKSHFERKMALKKHHPNRALNDAYHDLYNASLDARYLDSEQCPTAAEARAILIDRHLVTIQKYVESHSPA